MTEIAISWNLVNRELQISITNVYLYQIRYWLYIFRFLLQVWGNRSVGEKRCLEQPLGFVTDIYIYIYIYIYIRINLDSFDNILKVKPFFQKLQIVNLTNTKYDAAQKNQISIRLPPPLKVGLDPSLEICISAMW